MNLPALIRVTADHIRRGDVQECTSCPVALAIEDATEGTAFLQVYNKVAYVTVPERGEHRADLPEVAQAFIRAFDVCDPVAPLDFEVTWRPADGVEAIDA